MSALKLTVLCTACSFAAFAQPLETISKARLLYDSGQYTDAMHILESVEERNPGFEYHLLMGNTLHKLEKYVGALQQYEKALKENPSSAQVQAFTGAAYMSLKQSAEAEKHLKKALRLDPSLPEAHYYLGNLRYNEFSLSAAVRHYDEAIKLRPGYRDALYMRGATYSEGGKYREALRDFEAALKSDPKLTLASYNMALVYLEVDQYVRAAEILQQIEPERIPRQGEYYFHLAEALYFAGQKETACEYYSTASSLGDAQSSDIYRRHCIDRQTREALRKKRTIKASF